MHVLDYLKINQWIKEVTNDYWYSGSGWESIGKYKLSTIHSVNLRWSKIIPLFNNKML